MKHYSITTYGCAEYLCRVGLIPGKLTFERAVASVRPNIPITTIQEQVADHFQIALGDLRGKRRAREIVRPRQIAIYLAAKLNRQSLPAIGRMFDRDHTTVIHSIRQIEKLRAEDPDLNNAVTALQYSLEAA